VAQKTNSGKRGESNKKSLPRLGPTEPNDQGKNPKNEDRLKTTLAYRQRGGGEKNEISGDTRRGEKETRAILKRSLRLMKKRWYGRFEGKRKVCSE